MPATALTSTTQSRTVSNGVDLTAAGTAVDSVNDNTFQNDGTTLLRVRNTNAATRTLTVCFASQSVDGIALPSSPDTRGQTYVIPATTGDRLIGPFPVSIYGTTVTLKWTAATNVNHRRPPTHELRRADPWL